MPPDLLGQFGSDYLRTFGGNIAEEIAAYTGESYDATLMCIQAIRDSPAQPGQTLRERVIAAKQATRRYEKGYTSNLTVTGPYTYDSTRNFQNGGYYFVRKISGGAVNSVGKYQCREQVDGTCTALPLQQNAS
jgi:ABC-type branched-subunit amino acid transport system substrate-binding protein